MPDAYAASSAMGGSDEAGQHAGQWMSMNIEETMAVLTRCSFDEAHRQPIFMLGGIPALAELIQVCFMFIFYHFTFLGKIMPESTRRFKLPQKFFSSLLLNFWPLLMIFQSGACKMSNHRRGAHRLFPQFTVPPPLPKHMPIGTYILTY